MKSDADKIIKRLKMILHTFEQVEEKQHRVNMRLINVLEEMIEHAENVDPETDKDILRYLDQTSAFFIRRAQDYADFCDQNIVDMETIASSLEEDVVYMETACTMDYESYDLRYDFNSVIDKMAKKVDMDQAVFYFKTSYMSFNEFADVFYEFIESYEYAKKIDLVTEDLWNEYVNYCKALIYIKLDLDKIIKNKDMTKGISEDEFKKMMGEDK